MTKKPSEPRSGENQGEGDRESARRFNEKERAFVESKRGRDAIRSGNPPKTPEEERDLEDAEEAAHRRARENDPEESRDYRKPS
jgi:hypothetical protein